MLEFHVAISLVAMLVSIWCIISLFSNRLTPIQLGLFVVTHLLTSLSGFPLAPFGFDPPRAIGILSILLLIAFVIAFYAKHCAGACRLTFVLCFFAVSYLNYFVGVVQVFQKVPTLQALAPLQTELPFVLSQVALLFGFIALTTVGLTRIRRMPNAQLPV